jgi:chaperone modulatory protein CbpM
VGYALVLVRSASFNLEAFARATGTHPDLVRRLVTLGILDADRDAAGELWFAPSQVAVMGRVQRLRAGFGLNYTAVGLVNDLLDQIAVLEAALREARRPGR